MNNQIQLAISLLPISYVIATAIPLLVINRREKRLPNKIVIPLFLLTLLCWLTLAIWQGKWAELGLALLVFLGSFIAGIITNFKGWIGMGDVKYIATLSLIVGWFSLIAGLMLLATIFLVCILALFVAIILDYFGVIDIYKTNSFNLAPYIVGSFGLAMWYITL